MAGLFREVLLYSKAMGPILSGPFREVVGLKIAHNISLCAIVWNVNKAIDIGRWSVREVLLYLNLAKPN